MMEEGAMEEKSEGQEPMVSESAVGSAPGTKPKLAAVPGGAKAAEVRAARFADLDGGETPSGNETVDFLMDVGLSIGVELGRTEMLVRDVLKLSPGSVIELRRMATDPVEVFVNNRVVARGEVVVVDDKFGVRITEIVT